MKQFLRLTSLYFLIILTGCTAPVGTRFSESLRVGDRVLSVAIADTPDEQVQGLAGVMELSDSQGMLFVFTDDAKKTFWMKGMRIPIDIIWIAKGRVVGIISEAPVPEQGMAESDFPRYTSPDGVQMVLEVRAGWSKDNGLTIGESVSLSE